MPIYHPDTALRLAHYFGTSERFWLNLQTCYDLEVEKDIYTHVLNRGGKGTEPGRCGMSPGRLQP